MTVTWKKVAIRNTEQIQVAEAQRCLASVPVSLGSFSSGQ